jgi:hypothetical protein
MRFQIPVRLLGVLFWVVDAVAGGGIPSSDGGHSAPSQEDLKRRRVRVDWDIGRARFRARFAGSKTQ